MAKRASAIVALTAVGVTALAGSSLADTTAAHEPQRPAAATAPTTGETTADEVIEGSDLVKLTPADAPSARMGGGNDAFAARVDDLVDTHVTESAGLGVAVTHDDVVVYSSPKTGDLFATTGTTTIDRVEFAGGAGQSSAMGNIGTVYLGEDPDAPVRTVQAAEARSVNDLPFISRTGRDVGFKRVKGDAVTWDSPRTKSKVTSAWHKYRMPEHLEDDAGLSRSAQRSQDLWAYARIGRADTNFGYAVLNFSLRARPSSGKADRFHSKLTHSPSGDEWKTHKFTVDAKLSGKRGSMGLGTEVHVPWGRIAPINPATTSWKEKFHFGVQWYGIGWTPVNLATVEIFTVKSGKTPVFADKTYVRTDNWGNKAQWWQDRGW